MDPDTVYAIGNRTCWTRAAARSLGDLLGASTGRAGGRGRRERRPAPHVGHVTRASWRLSAVCPLWSRCSLKNQTSQLVQPTTTRTIRTTLCPPRNTSRAEPVVPVTVTQIPISTSQRVRDRRTNRNRPSPVARGGRGQLSRKRMCSTLASRWVRSRVVRDRILTVPVSL